MESILGIKGKDFVMLAADRIQFQTIVAMKTDENKIFPISDNLMMTIVGPPGDVMQFKEYISKNIVLFKVRNGYDMTSKAACHFTRKTVSEFMRSSVAYDVNLLIAGYDSFNGPELHYIDHMGNASSVNYASHGYGGLFCGSIFDRYHRNDITKDEAYEILVKCVREIHARLVISMPTFRAAKVDQNGVVFLNDIKGEKI